MLISKDVPMDILRDGRFNPMFYRRGFVKNYSYGGILLKKEGSFFYDVRDLERKTKNYGEIREPITSKLEEAELNIKINYPLLFLRGKTWSDDVLHRGSFPRLLLDGVPVRYEERDLLINEGQLKENLRKREIVDNPEFPFANKMIREVLKLEVQSIPKGAKGEFTLPTEVFSATEEKAWAWCIYPGTKFKIIDILEEGDREGYKIDFIIEITKHPKFYSPVEYFPSLKPLPKKIKDVWFEAFGPSVRWHKFNVLEE